MNIDRTHMSPNHGLRAGADISMLVLHATVGSFASSLSWLINPESGVSTHYLIRKDGFIAQLVPDELAAWHAGRSSWFNLGSEDIQRQSIGIELENRNDGIDPYPPAQLDAATELCRMLVARYRIALDMVTRHLDIATPRGRKTDPAGFPWQAWRIGLFDPWYEWGPIGKPEGIAQGFAVPRAWLANRKLGRCVQAETYALSGRYSVTEFENGLITYLKARNVALVELF